MQASYGIIFHLSYVHVPVQGFAQKLGTANFHGLWPCFPWKHMKIVVLVLWKTRISQRTREWYMLPMIHPFIFPSYPYPILPLWYSHDMVGGFIARLVGFTSQNHYHSLLWLVICTTIVPPLYHHCILLLSKKIPSNNPHSRRPTLLSPEFGTNITNVS